MTKVRKIRGRENISLGNWNVRTLRPAAELEELTHEMDRYHGNLPGLCEMSSDGRHKVYFSQAANRYEYGDGFLVYRDMVSAVLGLPNSPQQTNISPLESSCFLFQYLIGLHIGI